jgi:hypothetical protein
MYQFKVGTAPAPEPSTFVLLAVGLLCCAARRKRWRCHATVH